VTRFSVWVFGGHTFGWQVDAEHVGRVSLFDPFVRLSRVSNGSGLGRVERTSVCCHTVGRHVMRLVRVCLVGSVICGSSRVERALNSLRRELESAAIGGLRSSGA